MKQKKLLSKEQTLKNVEEEYLMDQRAYYFQEKQNRKDDGNEVFWKKKIKDENLKRYRKLKIQQVCLKGQCRETCNSFKSQD